MKRSFYYRLFCLLLSEWMGPDDSETDPYKYRHRTRWLRKAGLKIGKNSVIRSGLRIIISRCDHITIEDDVVIGPAVRLLNFNELRIGSGTVLAGYNLITNGGHDPDSFAPTSGVIQIGKRVLIDFGSQVVKPLTIEDDARILAGSVVTRDVGKGVTVQGCPAKDVSEVGRGMRPEWKYLPSGWPSGVNESTPWNEDSVAPYIEGWDNYQKLMNGTGPLAYLSPIACRGGAPENHPPTVYAQNVLLSFAVALLYVTKGKKAVSILDFGGATGYYRLIAEKWLPGVELTYVVVDLPPFCRKGREMMPKVTFSESVKGAGGKFDLVICSGALHYVKEWKQTLQELCSATQGALFLSRLQVVSGDSYVLACTPTIDGFTQTYSQWALSRSEIELICQQDRLRLVREFVGGEENVINGVPEQPQSRAYLFSLDIG